MVFDRGSPAGCEEAEALWVAGASGTRASGLGNAQGRREEEDEEEEGWARSPLNLCPSRRL